MNTAMSLSPQILLSSVAKERCIAKLKELPSFMLQKMNPKNRAAVLVPLCVDEGEVCLLYTLRSSNLKNHSGQVSFPGGKMDENETVYDTAVRETEEEIGIPHESIDLWGEMPQLQGRNKDVVVTPVVGLIKNFDMSQLVRNVDEVEEIFKIPMNIFCNKENHAHIMYQNLMLPVFMAGKHKVWGITGVITHAFLQSFLPDSEYKVHFERKKYTIDELLPSKL